MAILQAHSVSLQSLAEIQQFQGEALQSQGETLDNIVRILQAHGVELAAIRAILDTDGRGA